MQSSAPDLIFVLLIGTGVVVALLVFIFLMVLLSQRRLINYQVELRTLHAARQQELFKAVFEAQESERQRLAADLHDSVGQVLSVVKLNLHRLKKMELPTGELPARQQLLTETSALADDCLSETRHIIRNILPPLLIDYGLVEALRHLAEKLEKSTSIEVVFQAGPNLGRYGRETEVTLYRVAQELFSNALRHAQATRIEFSVIRQQDRLVFTFADNGIGFRLQDVTPGLGLKNLESRVGLLEGSIEMGPGTAGGTLTRIWVPASSPTIAARELI